MRDARRKSHHSFTTFHLIRRLLEGALILLAAVGVFVLISLVTFHHSDPSWSHQVDHVKIMNAGGRVGAWVSDLLLTIFGFVAYLFPVMLFYAAWVLYRGHHESDEPNYVRWTFAGLRSGGFLLGIISATGLLHLFVMPSMHTLPNHSGGVLGALVGGLLLGWFNRLGAIVVLIPVLLISITLFTGASWVQMIDALGGFILRNYTFLRARIAERGFSLRSFRVKLPPQLTALLQKMKKSKQALPTTTITPAIAPRASAIVEAKPEPEPEPTTLKTLIQRAIKKTPTPEPVVDAVPEAAVAMSVEKTYAQTPRYSRSRVLPKLSLLDAPSNEKSIGLTREMLESRSREVEACLNDFGVQAAVVAVHPGPVVTRFELDLAAGTKVSKITALAKDLARSLSVVSVRVVEVIPGKSYIGIELPNPNREMVTLKEVLASNSFKHSHSALALALGKDIAGSPVIVDLAKMPHLLVAGTTGSGKSVALNAMLLSLLYKSSPQDLRLILIDPKMLELAVYDGIPHLLAPVVTDMKDAASALRWCVVEMERRYRLMASLGVRNILGYNNKVRQAIQEGAPLLDPLLPPTDEEPQKELQILPKIVVLADEFADMMVVVGKKVETLIARLAQKARAAGIHLIFATQRPSVDVITGLIKANIPTRIAFQVSSKIDSRTIIDQQGADQLLGHGDMLYLPPGSGVPVRVHGCFASDDEVHRVVRDLKERDQPDYLDEILNNCVGSDPTGYTNSAMGIDDSDDGEKDELYDEAVHFVVKAQRVSVSSVQRRFKIGYNRAARMVEAMEEAGVVSKMEGNAQREVLVPAPVNT